MTSLKDTITAAQIAYNFNYSNLSDRFESEVGSADVEIKFSENYPSQEELESLLNQIFEAKTKSEKQELLLNLDSKLDLVNHLLNSELEAIRNYNSSNEDNYQAIEDSIELLSKASEALDQIDGNFTINKLSSEIGSTISDLEDEKVEYENILDIDSLEKEVNDFIYPLESLISLLKKEIENMMDDYKFETLLISEDDYSSEEPALQNEYLSVDHERLSKSGPTATETANLINRILLDQQFAVAMLKAQIEYNKPNE